MSRSNIPSKRTADAQEAAWVADEDRFALQQAKKKAAIRVKSNRAEPIDWLTVTLTLIDPERNPLDDEVDHGELDLVDPETVFANQDDAQLGSLEKQIDTFVTLETSRSNRDYWSLMKTICNDQRKSVQENQQTARGVGTVTSDIDRLLGPKSLGELEKLEVQINTKLRSGGDIDTDYWEHLLKSLLIHKARAKLRKVSQSIVDARLKGLRIQQAEEAAALKSHMEARAVAKTEVAGADASTPKASVAGTGSMHLLDPEPLLRLRQEDKALDAMTDQEFARRLTDDRRNTLKRGYLSYRSHTGPTSSYGSREPPAKRIRTDAGDGAQPFQTNYDREVARGLGDNEELFTQEEDVITKNRSQWVHLYRPRKPKHFNRVHLGYEWNKYNQTHYDHDNPPPKVVQGYRFNVFYPDLLDKTKAPTYRIERENGRRRGQTFAPAGEDDTCLIRFVAGPPYEDIAFRIVDKEWDYSAKRDRGFKSSFDKGVLQLHFQFKKIYYRK